jgi:O-antigen ligase
VLGAVVIAVALRAPGVLVLALSLVLVGYVMLVRPFLGLLLLVATIPLENAFPFAEGITGTRILGMGVAIAWLAGKVLRGESFRSLVSSGFFVIAGLFSVLVLASSMWAESPSVVRVGFFQLVMLFVFSLLVVDLSSSWLRVRQLVRALVLGALVAALLTLMQYVEGTVDRAGGGLAGGVNSTATMMVTVTPLAGLMILFEERWIWKACGLAYLLTAIAAISVTFSRMNYLLLPIVLLAIVWQTIRTRKGRIWFVTVAAGMAIVAAKQVPMEDVMERVSSIGPYVEQTLQPGSLGGQTTSGRGFHIRVALAVFRDHPVLGVGYNHFGYHFLHTYQYRVPGAKKRWTSWRSPHSSHFGILADLGLVGFLLWIGLLVIAARHLFQARSYMVRLGQTKHILLIRAVAYSFLLQALPYALYTPNQKAKILWLLLGLAVVLRRLAEAAVDEPNQLHRQRAHADLAPVVRQWPPPLSAPQSHRVSR